MAKTLEKARRNGCELKFISITQLRGCPHVLVS